jgi:two-component system OmpR family sensor kinase
MKTGSLTSKITLAFLFTFGLFSMIVFFYLRYENDRVSKDVVSYHQRVSKYLQNNKFSKLEVTKYMDVLNFKNIKKSNKIIRNGKKLMINANFETIKKDQKYYFYVINSQYKLLFEDLRKYEKNFFVYPILATMFFLTIFLYLWIIKSLRPLKELKEKISRFAEGDMNISCSSNKSDEIAEVANEFNNAAQKISNLIHSRQFFLRTIMHELKTPIAKGRIVSELIDDQKQKNRIINIFDRLNFIINDFAQTERIVSDNFNISRQNFTISAIIDKSIDHMMLENTKNKIVISNLGETVLYVDIDLFSFAIKNLLDNGIKYSFDNKVTINQVQNRLMIISKGNSLKMTLDEYFKPFHNNNENINQGLGLGLYIVYSILKMHCMKLEYDHKNSTNTFYIDIS